MRSWMTLGLVAAVAVGSAAAGRATAETCEDGHCQLRPPPAMGQVQAAILVQSPRQLPVALRSGIALLDGEEFAAEAVEIVVCGEAARGLTDLEPPLADALARGVDVVACGMTLEKLEIEASALARGVRVVPNGMIELLRRDAEGWATLEL